MEKIIREILSEHLKTNEAFIKENLSGLMVVSERISEAFTNERKLLICGNGGSAADAQHIAAEFVNRFGMERPPLPALALTTDTSVITSIGNDYAFKEIFSKQVKALGLEGDILLAISTSGNSENVLEAVSAARNQGIHTVGFAGGDGGRLGAAVDMAFVVRSSVTARIQEAHILAGHVICRLVEYILFQRHIAER